MGVFFIKLANSMIKGLGAVMGLLLSVFPKTPFPEIYDVNVPYLDGVGWILPVGEILTTLVAWTIVVAVFYVYMTVARWLKIIGG